MDFSDPADETGDAESSRDTATAKRAANATAADAKPSLMAVTMDQRRRGEPDGEMFAKAPDTPDAKRKAEFPWLYDPTRGVRWDFDPIRLRNLAQENTWVEMLIQSIAKEVAETPWTITDADRTETHKRLSTHPEEREPLAKDLPDATAERIYDFLHNPNPDDNWQDTVEMWLSDLLEVGSCTAVKAFPSRAYEGDEFIADPASVEPTILQTSAPEVWTKDYHDKTGILDGYWQFDTNSAPGGSNSYSRGQVRGISDPTFFDNSEVVWDDMSPRSNRRYGMPPTLLVHDFLESLDLAIEQEQEYLSRGSIPSGAWVFEQYNRTELKELKEEVLNNVKGKPHKSLTFAGMGGDVSFEPMSMNFQELEFTERMQWYSKVVAAAFQVPTAVVGLEPEKINYNTFQGERENFESNTLGPYLQQLERVINDQIIQPHWGAAYRFEYQPGMSETTRKMISDRVRAEFNSGLIRRNEARQETGRDPVDEEFDGFKDEVVEGTDEGDVPGAVDELVAAVDKADPCINGHALNQETGEVVCEDYGISLDVDDVNLSDACPLCGEQITHLGLPDDSDPTAKAEGDTDDLRNTDQWYQFDVQPGDIEALREAIADDIGELYDAVLSDERVAEIIETYATDDPDATAKSENALVRRLRDLVSSVGVASDVADAIRGHTTDAMSEAIRDAQSDVDEAASVDVEAVRAHLRNRDVGFANELADQLASDIRETVADGWAEGKGSEQIRQDIAEQADIKDGWNGAEKIARQELQIATGEARQAVADDLGKVEVWSTAGDGRVREAHGDMDGLWKRPGESWVVDYADAGRGVQKESVPGDSAAGIGCRCVTLLRERDEVDADDYGGDEAP